ncbi:GIN domain-containing protein [Pseudofulvibacter geojedonensis]|uniref:GIN domain-containing protein n=1 Tax=Pseudofulvibacter geojedonensis TaxID=1123758 RepID=A0ABW3I562_9FLAO
MKLKLLLVTFIIASVGFAQKKEKIKGNKLVKVKQHELAAFNSLSINEDIEVFILKGTTPMIEIEADENLHDIILFDVVDENLSIKTSHNITSKKKLSIRVTFTDVFNKIELQNKAVLNSLIDVELPSLKIYTRDASKLFFTAKVEDFKLFAQKKSKIELNLSGENCNIEMSESSDIKALINVSTLKFDLYQKANARIEGETGNLQLRADNATNFRGDKLTAQDCTMIAEGSSDCHIEVKDNLSLEASGSSEVYIYNTPKIDLRKFADSARLYKK